MKHEKKSKYLVIDTNGEEVGEFPSYSSADEFLAEWGIEGTIVPEVEE